MKPYICIELKKVKNAKIPYISQILVGDTAARGAVRRTT